MLTVERHDVFNFENAIRGARNPMNSWNRMDSRTEGGRFVFGEQDLDLAKRLCRSGTDHRKFMRQIFVSADIHAPLYWWKEFDTYKVGTTANSTSTMHKLHSRPLVLEDFSHDHLSGAALDLLRANLEFLEERRKEFVKTKEKDCWWDLIQLLPSGYNQLRTCTFNYENLVGMYANRKSHKLDEWRAFCAWVEELPYARDLICPGRE